MNFIFDAFKQAFLLIISLDPELIRIILLSLEVSGMALFLATIIGLPLGAVLGLYRIRAHGLAITLLNTMMGLPPVTVGLFVYLFLSRSGPLGTLGLLYTPAAMVIAQMILAAPIVASLVHSAIINVDPIIRQAATTLGATPFQASVAVVKEARYGIITSLLAGFGRLTAEVGAVIIVGGNIAGYTRVMTTTIALETDKGNFELAVALGIVLLMVSFIVNAATHIIQRTGLIPLR